MAIYDISDALAKLRPGEQWGITSNDFSLLEWFETETTPPSEIEVLDKLAELQAAEPLRMLEEEIQKRVDEVTQIILRHYLVKVPPLAVPTEYTSYIAALEDLYTTATPTLDSVFGEIEPGSVNWPAFPSNVEIYIDDASAVSEGQTALFQIRHTGTIPPGKDFVVEASTQDGTATANINYTPKTQNFTFTPNTPSTQLFYVQTLDDTLNDPGKNFLVNLTKISGVGTVLDNQANVTGNIIEVTTHPPALMFVDDAPTIEAGNPAVFNVRYTGTIETGQYITVQLSTADGTATDGANYTANTQSITFTDTGPSTQTFTVQTLDDGLDIPARNFFVNMTWVSGNGLITDGQAIVTGGLIVPLL